MAQSESQKIPDESRVRTWMYRQGLGDCFLLTLPSALQAGRARQGGAVFPNSPGPISAEFKEGRGLAW